MLLFKLLYFFLSVNINSWQEYVYNDLIKKVSSPTFPQTILIKHTAKSLSFASYAAFHDPKNKYASVISEKDAIPTWLFIMRYNGQKKDELSHRGSHFDTPCNVFVGNQILIHIKTAGFFSANIIFKVFYHFYKARYGVVSTFEMDKAYNNAQVDEFKMLIWAFPHPKIKDLVIVVTQGYIKSPYSVELIDNNIKWHVDSALENFGERLMVVKK